MAVLQKKMRLRFGMGTVRNILLLMVIAIDPLLTSAHFFPNATALPPSAAANKSSWDSFHGLIGCRKGIKAEGLEKLKKYFQYFGYLNSSYQDFSDEFDDHLDTAVKNYQLNFNLNATGELDETTLDRIVQPRCGNPDIVNGTTTMHSGNSSNTFRATVAHYSFFPNRPRWPAGRNTLTYAFLPGNQLSDDVKAVFDLAFERWSEVTTLTFAETGTFAAADIRIGFFSGDHGDGEPFDGVLGTLAHAFAPPSGRFHLDGDESWVIDGGSLNSPSMSVVDLESVAVHEIGHVLGLGHSSVPEAIMYPTIAAGTRKVELADDDITGIQELYGANPNFNGSDPASTPTNQRDASGAPRLTFSSALIAGFLIFVLYFLSFWNILIF